MTRDQVFAIANKYGAFEFGDAQGDKRLAFAAEIIAAHERIRDAAPDLLAALERLSVQAAIMCSALAGYDNTRPELLVAEARDAFQQVRAAITKARGTP